MKPKRSYKRSTKSVNGGKGVTYDPSKRKYVKRKTK